MRINWLRIVLVIAIVLANVGCDQVTKQIAREQLMSAGQISYLSDFFRLSYVENKGAFLSLGAGLSGELRYWALLMLPLALLVGLLAYTLFSENVNRWQAIAFSFIIGGGISNIYDRILYGQVVDFMNMGLGSLRTGIFNFADVSIMIGLGIMLPMIFRKDRNKSPDDET
ncbi:MAG: signal peptidase II [Phaeodactylibacter sp.]|nr:signal peptidase II [Phaeodactylibacter sp.]MCB9289853.1 signal peptidase II [Lewinellaceae bacterium]